MAEENLSSESLGNPFTSEAPHIVIGERVDDNNTSGLCLNISDDVKKHKQLGYTTCIETLKFILENRTIRSSSLNNAKLNDRMEKSRNGVEQFAGSRFITCFTHMECECIPFWAYYGGQDRAKKVQLVFDNFATRFEELFFLNYLFRDNSKVFFKTEKYAHTINQNGIMGNCLGLPKINTEYDMRNAVRSISIFDVDYVDVDDEVFTTDYSGIGNFEFGETSKLAIKQEYMQLQCYNPTCLGKHKSKPWSYECETRIMLTLDNQEFSEWDYLDLRFRDDIFRNMRIILSPWADEQSYNDLLELISNWNVSDEIKNTVKIQHSVVEGTLNI